MPSPGRDLHYASRVGAYEVPRGRYAFPAVLLVAGGAVCGMVGTVCALLILPAIAAWVVLAASGLALCAVLGPLSHPPPRFGIALPLIILSSGLFGLGIVLSDRAIADLDTHYALHLGARLARAEAARLRGGLQMLHAVSLAGAVANAGLSLYVAARLRTKPAPVLDM